MDDLIEVKPDNAFCAVRMRLVIPILQCLPPQNQTCTFQHTVTVLAS